MLRLNGLTIMILEDESLIALDMLAIFQAEGAEVIAARNVLEAFAIVQHTAISVAVLDVKLNGNCDPICNLLDHKRVPFIFHTGYASGGVLDEFPKACILSKPATRDQLIECVLGSLGKIASRRHLGSQQGHN
jgi:CheY-like chemotaxis protein